MTPYLSRLTIVLVKGRHHLSYRFPRREWEWGGHTALVTLRGKGDKETAVVIIYFDSTDQRKLTSQIC